MPYLDRVNVGFAKLQMLLDLHFNEAVYGLGAGVFFVGYFFFEIPSNLMLRKVGARRWISRIMVTWGLVSAAMLFVTTPLSFYVMRFLLGAAEAGFFPGIILYLTYWYPAAQRGRITALFMAAVPLSGVIGGPLSGFILDTTHGSGLAGWQWLFLLEGLPTVFLGLLVLAVLPDRPKDAKWLGDGERKVIEDALARDGKAHTQAFGLASRDWRIWLLSAIYFCTTMASMPSAFGCRPLSRRPDFKSGLAIGWMSALPYLAATIFMLALGRSADRFRERRWHLAGPLAMGCLGLAVSAQFADDVAISMTFLTIATMGFIGALPMFWPLPTAFLGGAAAAGGFALINSFGNLAGFCSPYFVGWIKDATGSTNEALFVIAAIALFGAVLVMLVPARLVGR